MDELTFDLESAMNVANSNGTAVDLTSYDALFNQTSMSTSGYVCSAIMLVWAIICMWRMFQKAGLPGWGSLIPFYNIYLRLKMAGRSGRWLLSLLFPPLFAIILIVTYFDIAKRFGKHWTFGLGLWFLYPIFVGILAFDKSTYTSKK